MIALPPHRSNGRRTPARVWPRLAVALACLCALAAPLTAGADSQAETVLSPGLLDAAEAQPDSAFDVIVEGSTDSGAVAAEAEFVTVPAVAATLSGSEIVALAEGPDPLVITRDGQVAASGEPIETLPSDELRVSGDPEPGVELTATPDGPSYRWQRCGDGLREAATLTDSPLDYWSLGARQDDVDVEGAVPDPSEPGFSLEGWISLDSPLSDQPLITRWSMRGGPMFGPRLRESGRLTLYLDGDGHYGLIVGAQATVVSTSVAPTIGEREHVVATLDGSRVRLYRNGVQIGSEPLLVESRGNFLHVTIATAVDNVAAYERALSPSEVQGHYAGCTVISGADGSSYRPVADDLGLNLRVVANGSASALTAPVTARRPVATAPPSILGTTEEGQTLQAANGSWEGTQPYEFAYQWERCEPSGDSCVNIYRATESSYVLTRKDVGATIRLAVTARGVWGDGFALAEPASVVTPIPEPLPKFKQHWPYVAGVPSLLSSLGGRELQTPAIAIVDSGIDGNRADFGGRVVERVTLNSRSESQLPDGNGHGTAVASVAAGEGEGYTGAAPDANLVDVDVLDDEGVANVSDVIAAADWIYENRERLNIRVVNFSLHGTTLASIVSDPLDKAVERLWLSGIVVVTASGNYGVDGEESAVPFAPGNDPFVITVGATDTRGSYSRRDDVAAPWSAWGYTRDGFAKPDLAAPGRYIAAAVPADSKLARNKPDRIVEPGYMQLSGTSLAAPVVAGTAASLLAVHPGWTPDQVKGALMLTAEPLPRTKARSVGVGALDAAKAVAVDHPPNPNLALNGFLIVDPTGGSPAVFDSDRWTSAVQTDPAWASVAWGSVAWGSAAWSSVAWGSVAWGSVAWGSVAWGSVAWGSVAWGSVAWGSDAEDDVRPQGGYWTRRN
jgi:serine protease AprX